MGCEHYGRDDPQEAEEHFDELLLVTISKLGRHTSSAERRGTSAGMQAVRRQLDQLFTVHAAVAIVTGALCFLTPHSQLSPILGDANNTHFAHEFIRLYGALTLAQGWLVWRTRLVSDALIRRTFCQAYCICFSLQALALIRAQISAPESHSVLHWFNILILGGLGAAYGYFLFFKTIKAFELPGADKSGL